MMDDALYAGRCQDLFFQFLALAAFRASVDGQPTEVRDRMIDNTLDSWLRIVEMQPMGGAGQVSGERRKQIHDALRKKFRKMLDEKIL